MAARAPDATLPLLWILSRSSRLYSTRRLTLAARTRGFRSRVVDPATVGLAWTAAGSVVVHGTRAVAIPDVVIPRIGAASARAGLAVVSHLELMGCRPVNPSGAIARARDKLSCAQVLVEGGVPVPPSVVVRERRSLDAALALLGGFPVVVKLLRGSQGIGVMLAHTRAELVTHAQALWQAGEDVLLQAFIEEAGGTDIRAFVVGGQLVAAMERRARPGEFRANVHRGGSARALELPPATRALAARAAALLGLGVAGVDLVQSRGGPLVLEVNASPGLRGIETATGLDVAGSIVAHAASLLQRAQRSRLRPAPQA